MNRKTNIALVVLALNVGRVTAFGQTQLYVHDFQNLTGWATGGAVQMSNPGEQLVLTSTVSSPTPTNNPVATCGAAFPPDLFPPAPLPDQQTLELRVDLAGANQNDAFAYLQWWVPSWTGVGKGYALFKDEDEIGLIKSWNDAAANACFFWTNAPLKNQNVTLVLALTRVGSDLRITSRVLDKDNANAVLFERTVTDTPQSNPVLPSGAVKGLLMQGDIAATPWFLQERGCAYLGVWWANTQSAPQFPAQVIFDNMEVWQYESPQLAIQNAVVLSWPLAQGLFVLESASSVTGPWETVPAPWSRTNASQIQVSVPASENLKLFRLRFAP
jgi:hypothetical protein